MEQVTISQVLGDPGARQLYETTEVARLAYTAKDGSPRVVPIGYVWRPPRFVVFTNPRAPKVRALIADPRVALTIDTDSFPCLALLVRGEASVEIVDGVPDDYIETNRKRATPEDHEVWEANVRRLYDQMVRITISPTWAKVLDSETRLPTSVEEIIRRKAASS